MGHASKVEPLPRMCEDLGSGPSSADKKQVLGRGIVFEWILLKVTLNFNLIFDNPCCIILGHCLTCVLYVSTYYFIDKNALVID